MGSTQIYRLQGDKPYTVNVEHRISQPQAAAVHETEAELFYVIDGSAIMTTGGKLVAVAEIAAGALKPVRVLNL